LEVDELTLPLIALGLSNDSSFVLKLLRSIDSEKFDGNRELAKITIKDFSKIFKKDFINEKIISVIKTTILSQRKVVTPKIYAPYTKDRQGVTSGETKVVISSAEDGRTTAPTSNGGIKSSMSNFQIQGRHKRIFESRLSSVQQTNREASDRSPG